MDTVVAAVAVVLMASNADALVKVGSFNNHQHGIAGEVYAQDEKTILIKGFKYDGAGPDAFFWAGTEGSPTNVGTILPYPFKGKFYEYEDQAAPILSGRFDGSVEITLKLPENLKVGQLKWLSVWCRAFRVNFGDIYFPDNLQLDSTEEAAAEEPKNDELPHPVVGNDVDNDKHNDGDTDAYAETEPESEPEAEAEPGTEPEPENGGAALRTTVTSLLALLLMPTFLKMF